MQRQIRYGVFSTMRLQHNEEAAGPKGRVPPLVLLAITADGRMVDEIGALLPPIMGRDCRGFPTPINILDDPGM